MKMMNKNVKDKQLNGLLPWSVIPQSMNKNVKNKKLNCSLKIAG